MLRPRPWRIEDDPGAWLADAAAATLPLLLLLRLDQPPPHGLASAEPLRSWLNPRERQRFAAMRRPDDQQRFLLARAGLRRLLGAWRGEAAARVPIACAHRGKPFCPGGPQFNVSHSGDLILLALHPEQRVGVDVERHRAALAWEPIARRVLPPAELAELATLPQPQRPQAFLQAWCRLEARLKARGSGLAGLERLRQEGGEGQPGRGERLWDLQLPPGYRGALACLEPLV